MPERWRVAIIDSGLDRDASLPVVAARQFQDDGAAVADSPAGGDRLGHGTAIARIVCGQAHMPALTAGQRDACGLAPELIVAQVFGAAPRTTPAAVAAALRWSLQEGAQLIHLSLGLREDREILALAVCDAIDHGCPIVASVPARGAATFPGAYAKVIRASGDARCAPGEISALGIDRVHFGGCPRYEGRRPMAGASVGAAHVSQFALRNLPARSNVQQVRAALTAAATYTGLERRTGA